MSALRKFSLEYEVTTTPRLLYTAISTPEGLARWFADLVEADQDVFHFHWKGSAQKARMVKFKDNEFVQFIWLDDYGHDQCWEMRVVTDAVSTGVALVVIDFAEDVDLDFSQRIWDAQVKKLQRLFHF